MRKRRYGMTIIYGIAALIFFILAAVLSTHDTLKNMTFITVIGGLGALWACMLNLSIYDLWIEDDVLVLKSNFKEKRLPLNETDITSIVFFGRPYFHVFFNHTKFGINYTNDNYTELKSVIQKCRSSVMSEQDFRRKVEKNLWSLV